MVGRFRTRSPGPVGAWEKGVSAECHGLSARAPDTAQPIRPSRLPQLPEAARSLCGSPGTGPESLGLRRASQASPLVRKEVVVKLGWGTLGFQVLTPTPSSSWLPTARGDDLGHSDLDLPSPVEGGGLPANSAGTCAGRDALVPGSRQPPTPHLQLAPAASPADHDGWRLPYSPSSSSPLPSNTHQSPATPLLAAARCPASRLSGRPPVLLLLLPLSQQEQQQQQHSTRVDAFKRARAASRPS
ncbi:hypothetical protein PCL_10606 [Purpureocillium lilacinum]|uniref:Uncharacterized protein n=1 Tax=Purpureocillium lilacinum TaxID=33203 RepID=A0A2U3EBZ5_PURLI|nr:hypothetical protein Purlil1_9145 [Purpureocillium lilacinum]PWI71983.1 hypothetical protein PCL_10606 [Purpureocillium lilacinum]